MFNSCCVVDGCHCSFIVIMGQEFRCTRWVLTTINLTVWNPQGRELEPDLHIGFSCCEKGIKQSQNKDKLREREPIHSGPCLALFSATMAYSYGSSQER